MLASSPAAFVMLLLSASSATERTCPPPGETEGRCIELTADSALNVSEIQISPGQPTTFRFDSDVRADGLLLGNREHFEVAQGKRLITLEPSEKLRGAKQDTLTVCFADAAAPACTAFRLVVHPAVGERRVEIFRHARPVDSVQAELLKTREENTSLRAENERLLSERSTPDGLTGLLDSKVMDEAGIRCAQSRVLALPGNTMSVQEIIACRSRGRMALRVKLENPIGVDTWPTHGAKLVGLKGEEVKASVWQSTPLLSNPQNALFIEARAEDLLTEGPFLLKLWEVEGPRTLTLGNITFPALAERSGSSAE